MIEDEEVVDPSQVKVHEILHTGTCGLSDAVQIAFLLQKLNSIFYKKEVRPYISQDCSFCTFQ